MFVGVVTPRYQHISVENGVPQLPQTYIQSPLTKYTLTYIDKTLYFQSYLIT